MHDATMPAEPFRPAPGLTRRAVAFVAAFYERNLFERIIIYLFLAAFIVKVVFEFGMGQWGFVQSQNRQWVFYGLLALDYLVSARKVFNIRVTVNPMSLFALVFFVMCAHGLFMGIMLGNAPFVIFNDLVPPLMIGLNILRMQSVTEYKPVDFRFLLTACTLLAIGSSVFGYAGQAIGNPTWPDIGESKIYIPLLFAALFTLRPFPKWVGVAALIMISLTLGDINRTTMAFIAVTAVGYMLIMTIRNPVRGVLAGLATVVVLAAAVSTVSPNSKTYQRVTGLMEIDLSERKGAIGERQAEWDAIQAKLERGGPNVEWLGLGFGGLYDVARTHEFLKNQGHAHYAWAWFNLRFGKSGYVYMTLLVAALVYNGVRAIRERTENGLFVCFLCLLGLIYCMTHVNSVFLLSGSHFFYPLGDKFRAGGPPPT